MTNISLKKRYKIIDSFRGLAILWIVCFHVLAGVREQYGFFLNYIISQGGLGVSIFFVISGYGISSSILREDYWGKPLLFLQKRFKRIFLVYWWHLLFAALLIPVVSSLISYAKSHNLEIGWFHYTFSEWLQIVTLTKVFTASDWKLNIVFLPINGVVWFLAIIIQIYLFVSVCLVFSQKFCSVLLFICFLVSLVSSFSTIKEFFVVGLFIPSFAMFYLGFILHFLLQRKLVPKKNIWKIIMLLSSTIFVYYCFINENQLRSLSFALLTSVALLLLWEYDDKLSKIFLIKLFYIFGIFSYSLYLLHIPLWPFVGMFVHNFIPLPYAVSGPFILVPGIVILSFLWYLFFEKPATFKGIFKNIFSPINTIRVAARSFFNMLFAK